MVEILHAEVSPFCTNAFLVVGEGGGKAALIDPGGDPEVIEEMIRRSRSGVEYIVATHCHMDHVGAAKEMCRRLGLGLMAGREDAFLLDGLDEACALYGLPPVEKPVVSEYLEDGMELPLGGSTLRFLKAPGHTPGSFAVMADGKDLFVGDVLFRGGVGRTDLPGGDTATLAATIRDVVLPLDDDTVLHCGHGPSTTVGRERRDNFFIIEWGLAR